MVHARSLDYVLVSSNICFFSSFDCSELHKLTRQCAYRIRSSLTRRTLDGGPAKFDSAQEMFVVSETADESSVERQRSKGVWLEVEGSRSFMPFKVPPTCYRCTDAVYTKRTGLRLALVLCIFIYVRVTLMLLTIIRQRPAPPLHSTYFFRTVFELQNTPYIPAYDVTSTGHEKVWQADRLGAY
ncbi:hypothetical protein EDD22DRAFT_335722 [Suillus occidentalis]|nr:hypothetical protein EDD22DRAFT_335722 [Suillus occidentalis]